MLGPQAGLILLRYRQQRQPLPGAHHTDLPCWDLDLCMWKLMAVAALCFLACPRCLGISSKQRGDICVAHVVSLCFKCFRCFIQMLQVFHLDVAKIDRDIAHVSMTIHVCFKCKFQMLHLFFQTFAANVLFGCCICFTRTLQVFYLGVAYVCNGFQLFCKCFSCFIHMLQVFHLNFKSRSECCICCNVTHHTTTGCCSCLGAMHVHGGAKGWSTARQRAREAEDDGSRGAGSPYAACWCGKLRRRGRKAEGA
jgi:hypothetical protein